MHSKMPSIFQRFVFSHTMYVKLYHTSMFLTNQIAQNEVIYFTYYTSQFTYYTSQFTYYTSQFTYHTAEWTRCEQNSYTVVAWKKI